MTLARELGLTPGQSTAAWSAIHRVLFANGAPGQDGRRLLEVAASQLEVSPAEAGAAIDDAAIAAAFPDPAARRVLADVLLVPACIEGEVTEAGAREVRAIADALGVRSPWVDLLPALRRRRVLSLKRALATRAPDGRRLLARTWSEDGFRGLFEAFLFVLGRFRDEALAARFRALGAPPTGTFGRAFFDSLASKQLAFPGEAGGMPERMIRHDLMHVATGYDTDPAGECELAGFYAAFTDGEPFTFIVVALATFQLGLAVSPAVVTPARGAFDPARVAAAFLRGRRMRVDVLGRWDYWSLLPLPLEEARARLGIAEAASATNSAR